jgi:membrane-associated phospholipid phosphatase
MTHTNRSSIESKNSTAANASLRIPSLQFFRLFLWNATWVTCLWFVVYGGADWITSLHKFRVSVQTPLDVAIPLVPVAAIVYLSLFPMLWLAPFVLHTPQQLREFALNLAIVILVAGIGFVLLPVEPIASNSVETNFSVSVFHFADEINLKYNCFPSLHVAMAVVGAASFSRATSARIASVFWLWAVMIALSTLLTRQHYIVDILAGGLLGAAVTFKRPSMPSRENWL